MTADSEIVQNVSRDALRWAEAMRRAAADMTAQHEVGETFRITFFKSWNSWTQATSGEDGKIGLPTDWKNSLDRFREAGLPVEAISGIVEKAMRKGGVKTENRFRYFCGITWRMIGELQERARAYVSDGEGESKTIELHPLDHAAVETWKASWTEDHEESPTHQQVSTFTESLSLLREAERWVDPIRTITAAVHGAGERCGTIQESLESLSEQERADIVMEWVDAWYFLTGDAPDNNFLSVVQDQVDKVSNISPSSHRLKIAACVAAYHRSWNLHHGLTPNELAALDHSADRQNAIDIWTRCFYEAGRQWPSNEEVTAYLRELDTVGGCPAGEVSSAAARAGTSLSTALREFLAEQPTTEVTSRGSERGSEGSVLAFRPRAKRWQADGEGER